MIAFKYSHWEKTFINILVGGGVANQNGHDVSSFVHFSRQALQAGKASSER